MAACSFCEQRKGKRNCPALGGPICSICCGQHRLTRIACPSDCVHLGGLAIVRGDSVTFTKDDYNAAVAQLMNYSRVDADPAFGEIFGGEANEWEQPIVIAFLIYGDRDTHGHRLVDRFMAARGRSLPRGVVAALRALQDARASLFEVEDVKRGVGLDLRDLVSGEQCNVHEVSATAQLKKWDVLFGWVMSVDGHLEFTGAMCLIPRVHLERAQAALVAELAIERKEFPDVPAADLIGSVAWAPVLAVRAAIADQPPPQMRTTGGDELVFCKAHYAIRDRSHLLARLGQLSELEPDERGFVWLDRAGKSRRAATATVLGRITIDGDGLVLETMSSERNVRGKRMLDKLGTVLAHRIDSIQDVEAALESHRERDSSKEDEVDEHDHDDELGEYFRDYYAKWLDEPIPALGDKTPRKAARTKRGRVQVAALLKEIENGTLGQPGGSAVDFDALRREVGLIEEVAEVARYDANQAPESRSWLASDESARHRAVEAHHQNLETHPGMPNEQLHTTMHVIVENQLAANDPPEVSATLKRLVADGLTRHEAVHAIASVVAEALFGVMKKRQKADLVAIGRALARLRPEPWRF